MKKLLAVLVLVLFGTMSYAQWSAGPGNLYMLSAGNVGIGVTAPSNDLQMSDATGPCTIILNSDVAVPGGAGSYTLGQYDMRHMGNTGYFYRNVLRYNRDISQYEMLQTLKNPGGNLNFILVNLNTGNFDMQSGISNVTFNNTGTFAVGMGALPVPAGAKVAVGGKVVCKEIEVTLTGMPDFVFSNDYKLRSLYDVENFIKANKHLPDVPSEQEVTANGLNLGDMNATLLQKVEELTLYMIDLKKENDALKTRVSNLEK